MRHRWGVLSRRRTDAARIEDVIPRIARQGQIHAPGAELSYCNSGAVLAGYLAQRLLGTSWYTLIEERIFKPLELQHSVVQPADALLVPRWAIFSTRMVRTSEPRSPF